MEVGLAQTWVPKLGRQSGPAYLALVDELAGAIARGELAAGTRLPPQRELAELLEIDVTTVSRAMVLAQTRGLIVARGRAGSFVAPARRSAATANEVIDLSINYPPALSEDLQNELRAIMRDVAVNAPAERLFDYPRTGLRTSSPDVLPWFEMLRVPADTNRIVIAGGGQQALIGITGLLCEPGDAILASGLTYPGMITVARRMGVRVVGIDSDEQGIMPEALAEVCERTRAKYLYVVTSFNNPTTSTLSARRRSEIAGVVEKYNLILVEDDEHAALLDTPIPPIAAHIPDRTFYVGSLSKSVSPGLRSGLVVAPSEREAQRLSTALFALGQFAAPIATDTAARVIETGAAERMAAWMRAAARSRWTLAQKILPELKAGIAPTNHFGWLQLPNRWRAESFVERCRELGVQITGPNAFAVSTKYLTNGVRVCIGAARTEQQLEDALHTIATALREDAAGLRPPY